MEELQPPINIPYFHLHNDQLVLAPAFLDQIKQELVTEGWTPPSDIVPLYLEAHVTIEPVFDEERERAAAIAARYNFKLAHLLMKKDRKATEVRSDRDTFMTGHSKSKADIRSRVKSLVQDLVAEGFKVWRYKVEDTLMDSRNSDEFGLL